MKEGSKLQKRIEETGAHTMDNAHKKLSFSSIVKTFSRLREVSTEQNHRSVLKANNNTLTAPDFCFVNQHKESTLYLPETTV